MDPFKSGGSSSSSFGSSSFSGFGSRSNSGGFETDIRPIGQPQGRRPRPRSPIATFLGSDALPGSASSSFAGGKTLMGE